MQNKLEDAVFIGGGWVDSQLLYILPIVEGYCLKKNIKKIYFDKKIPEKVISNPQITQIINEFEIKYCPTKKYFKLKLLQNFFNNLIFLFRNINLKRELLLTNKNWTKSQIEHSIWDLAINRGADGLINPKIYNKIYAIYKAMIEIEKSIWLKNKNVKSAFLGHTVYENRALLAHLRQYADTYSHSAYHIYSIPTLYDLSATRFDIGYLNKILPIASKTEVDKYWLGRISGNSNYEDSKNAFRGGDSENKNYLECKNIVMLHIFRDSPFNYIETDRIFSDYIDWIIATIKIISKSKEKWIIKTHPSANRWGENQDIWLNKIIKYCNVENIDNIKIIKNVSNIKILEKAKRLVTYGGTVHLEAAAFGLRPIVIDGTTIEDILPFSVNKPKSLMDYENLLLEDSDSKKFRGNNKSIDLSKTIIYIREVITNIRKEVGGIVLYRSDGRDLIDEDFKITNAKVISEYRFLKELGSEIALGMKHSLSKDFFNKIDHS